MSGRRPNHFFAILLAASAVAGCSGGMQRAYPGPTLARSEVAVVQGAATEAWIEGGSSLVALRSIDGLRRTGAWNGEPQAEVELLPGKHLLGVEFHVGSGFAAAPGRGNAEELEVNLNAGRRYVVSFSRDYGAFFFSEMARENVYPTTPITGGTVRCIPSSPTRSRCSAPEVSAE